MTSKGGDPHQQLSEYELQRLERIKKNEAYLESLGLKSAKQKMLEMTKRTQKNQRRTTKKIVIQPGQERRSNRHNKVTNDNNKLLMLSYRGETDRDLRAIDQNDSDVSSGNSSEDEDVIPPSRRRLPAAVVSLTEDEKKVLAANQMDENYLTKFKEFLIYHNKISDQNVRNVMRQVTKLATGEGVHYDSARFGWKPHQIFYKGIKVTPLSDFPHIMQLAQEAEDKWGRDHGNGWLLSHPLKKMLLFQQFCLQNPDFLAAKCKLKEYYEIQNNDNQAEEVEDTMEEVVTTTTAVVSSSGSEDGDEEKDGGNPEPAVVTPPPKKTTTSKKRKSTTTATTANNNKKTKHDKHVGCCVAKFFGEELFFGTVKSYDEGARWWSIEYDDGDTEEMNDKEVKKALKLFQENKQKRS
ncbi:expressed unknown protein [Seminavis robusta]|uniref:PTM/DIR17-like Tudor domain-containing protein n=1 Tax=Seminavis robusta TaxID=568900 RepID=A0A9N8DQ82_9STRA|nr:expressed unknown protein [Seminavis robusta]|eukprot:Sro181_g078960.1 n/a (409) ;mRNA; f:9131-10357